MDAKAFPVTRSDAEWRRILTPEQYDVMRGHATEMPGSCALLYEKRAGRFSCVGCGQPLFGSQLKFESGTGWPSFRDPIEGESRRRSTPATAWCGPRCTVRIAEAIWGTYSPMVHRQPIGATASTASPCTSARTDNARGHQSLGHLWQVVHWPRRNSANAAL